MMLTRLLWIPVSFFLGALPLSVWIGRLALRADIRAYGDSNPGATNVLHAGGRGWFLLALMLDISKAAAPVGLARQVWGWDGWLMGAVAMAPLLGHAFSPFLRGRGGKAVATTLGAWIGLTLWEVPLVSILALLFWFTLQDNSGWAVMLALLSIMGYLARFNPDPLLIGVVLGQLAFMLYAQRADLRKRPSPAPFWWLKRLRRAKAQ
jgi:glycerol-3-phosphate acyltransferase PlsY